MKVMKETNTMTAIPVTTPFLANPEIDEVVWQAWLEKNREHDRMRFRRRLKVMGYLVPLLAAGALVWSYLT